MSKKEGFWVRFWMEKERSFKTEETYEYLTYEEGCDEKDEESLKSFAEDWAQNDCRGYNSEYYRYGFEVVPKPPKEWLEKELKRLKEEQELLTLIKEELGIIKGDE